MWLKNKEGKSTAILKVLTIVLAITVIGLGVAIGMTLVRSQAFDSATGRPSDSATYTKYVLAMRRRKK